MDGSGKQSIDLVQTRAHKLKTIRETRLPFPLQAGYQPFSLLFDCIKSSYFQIPSPFSLSLSTSFSPLSLSIFLLLALSPTESTSQKSYFRSKQNRKMHFHELSSAINSLSFPHQLPLTTNQLSLSITVCLCRSLSLFLYFACSPFSPPASKLPSIKLVPPFL